MLVFRESLRVLPSLLADSLWELTPSENNYYDWIYAALSVMMGHGVMWNYWLERPRRFRAKNNRKRYSILTDHRILWASFLWFTRSAFTFAMVLGITFSYGFEELSFYEEFRFLFPLMMVVFYLQSWNSLRKIYRRKVWKRFGVTTLVLLVFTYGLTRFSLVDPVAINQSLVEKNPILGIQLDLPQSKLGEKVQRLSLAKYVFVTHSDEGMEIYIDRLQVNPRQLTTALDVWKRGIYGMERDMAYVVLFMDKSVPMEDVDRIHLAIAKAQISRIQAAVTLDDHSNKNSSFRTALRYTKTFNYINPKWPYIAPDAPPPPLPPRLPISFYKDVLALDFNSVGGKFSCRMVKGENERTMATSDLFVALEDSLRRKPKTLLIFSPHPEMNYGEYLSVLEIHRQVVYRLRKEWFSERSSSKFEVVQKFAHGRYGRLSETDMELYREATNAFPIRMYEE
ncbi:MAG: hypothetical protein SchgKO_23320 [Schleiferiaceae bacterium]